MYGLHKVFVILHLYLDNAKCNAKGVTSSKLGRLGVSLVLARKLREKEN